MTFCLYFILALLTWYWNTIWKELKWRLDFYYRIHFIFLHFILHIHIYIYIYTRTHTHNDPSKVTVAHIIIKCAYRLLSTPDNMLGITKIHPISVFSLIKMGESMLESCPSSWRDADQMQNAAKTVLETGLWVSHESHGLTWEETSWPLSSEASGREGRFQLWFLSTSLAYQVGRPCMWREDSVVLGWSSDVLSDGGKDSHWNDALILRKTSTVLWELPIHLMLLSLSWAHFSFLNCCWVCLNLL